MQALLRRPCVIAQCSQLPPRREVRRATEGDLPVSVGADNNIDYSAGLEAKEQLMRKLERR